MKITLFSLICLLMISGATAQSIDRFVIGATGGSDGNATVQIESTVGELVVTTVETGTLVLNQGFHQTNPPYNTGIKPEPLILDYKLYPNPTDGMVRLELQSADPVDLRIQVWDITGRRTRLPSQELLHQQQMTVDLDLSREAAGVYLIAIQNLSDQSMQTLKVEKR